MTATILHSSPYPGTATPLRRPADPAAATADGDLRMAARAKSGDDAAHRQLAEALTPLPAMLRVKNARIGTPLRPHELEDAVQNTLLAVFRKLHLYDGRVPILRWAYGFGVIELLRTIERRARRREQELKVEPVLEPRVDEVDHERIARALASLDADDRTVIEQRHLAELSFEQIAGSMQLPLSTVKSRYYRGLQRLRDKVRGEEVGNS